MTLLALDRRENRENGRRRTPRRLPEPFQQLADAHPRVQATRPFRIHYGAAGPIDVPAGADLELLGYSERSGLPIVASLALGITGAVVDPDSIALPTSGTVRPDA